MNIKTLTQMTHHDWLEFAIYNLEDRAVPNVIDGLKPSQRFILYSTLKNAKDKFKKVAEIAGSVSSYGYHHAETSAQDAAINMAAEWQNNYPLLEGDGNFGTRLVPKASAARYVFAKLHKNYTNFFIDDDLAPEHPDEEILIPKFYLPIIPFVLVNGVKGTATGYATLILPYDALEIAKLCKAYLGGKNIDNYSLIPKFPQFSGKVERNAKGGFDLIGNYTKISETKLEINEVPYQYDREHYIEVLDDLEEKGIIAGYDDPCDDGFRFIIKLRRGFKGDIEKIFKLRRSITENLNVIDQNGKLKEYDNPIQLIKDFCDFRITYVDLRIKTEISRLIADMALLKAKMKFIELVLENKIEFKNKSKKILSDDLISLKFNVDHLDALLSMNFYHLTVEEIDKLGSKYLTLNDRLHYCKSTNANKEYMLNIEQLIKQLK